MAIFVALIFQVLFVFFAMAINIGLVVHDKINLQNSVDLAAYYAAQRQAEWLNVIAHQNYQIRQSYKLLSWRYRVLGTMGQTGHPATTGGVGPDESADQFEYPVSCIAYNPGFSYSNDSLCKQPFKLEEAQNLVDSIDDVEIISFNIGLMQNLSNIIGSVNTQIGEDCNRYGGLNYFYTNLIKLGYRLDQAQLKRTIKAQARNMAKPQNEFLDLNGDPVYDGVSKTVRKNLTYENRESLQNITMFNSIENLPPEQWLNEIKVKIETLYADVVVNSAGCQSLTLPSTTPPVNPDGKAQLASMLGGMSLEEIQTMFADPSSESDLRMSLGFEKNPWVKVYAGVKATTKPRQIFFPFGDAIQFEAVAYASPFGGRIGPWYKTRWPQGASSSDGNKTDPHAVPLIVDDSGAISNTEKARLMPNYSRYPGDPIGLASQLAQSSLQGVANFTGSLAAFREITNYGAGTPIDPMVWNEGMANTPLRQFEIAAVAPDLFDITFYSIEPNYGRTYLPLLRENQDAFGYPTDGYPRQDLGGRDDDESLVGFSVQDQMAFSGENSVELQGGLAAPPKLHKPEAYYFIRDRAHLLTSWVHNDVVASFVNDAESFPKARFGSCAEFDDTYDVKIPGTCLYNGGRTGYSVKIESGQHLRSNQLEYGGAGQKGPILNPPPDPSQW